MKKLTRKQIILLAVMLVLFAILKIATILYWQQYKQGDTSSAVSLPVACEIRNGCQLSNGVVLTFDGKVSDKTRFNIIATNVPEHIDTLYVSFSMKSMDMGFNRYKLLPHANGTWIAEDIRLPICVLQLKDYIAEVTIGQEHYEIPFRID